MDPMLGCSVAFISALTDRILSEKQFSFQYHTQGPALVNWEVQRTGQEMRQSYLGSR